MDGEGSHGVLTGKQISPLVLFGGALRCWFVVSVVSRPPPSVWPRCCCSSPPRLWPWRQLCFGTSCTKTGDPIHIAGNTLSKKEEKHDTLALKWHRIIPLCISTWILPYGSVYWTMDYWSHQREGHKLLSRHAVNIVLWNSKSGREKVTQHCPGKTNCSVNTPVL